MDGTGGQVGCGVTSNHWTAQRDLSFLKKNDSFSKMRAGFGWGVPCPFRWVLGLSVVDFPIDLPVEAWSPSL